MARKQSDKKLGDMTLVELEEFFDTLEQLVQYSGKEVH